MTRDELSWHIWRRVRESIWNRIAGQTGGRAHQQVWARVFLSVESGVEQVGQRTFSQAEEDYDELG